MAMSFASSRVSWLSRFNPTAKLFVLILGSVLISQSGKQGALCAFAISIAIACSAKINPLKLLAGSSAMVFVALMIAITEYWSTEDALPSMIEALRFLSLYIASASFAFSTDQSQMAASLGSALSYIIGKSAWRISSAVMLTISMLPWIYSSASTMYTARRARGGSFISHPIRNLTEYTVSLMLVLIRKAETFQDALESRSFSDTAQREAPPYRAKDVIAISSAIIATGAFLWIKLG